MMDEQMDGQQAAPTKYEQLYNILHAYRFGAISFLELLDQFEEVWAFLSQARLSPAPPHIQNQPKKD
jgi:hypothetical protein